MSRVGTREQKEGRGRGAQSDAGFEASALAGKHAPSAPCPPPIRLLFWCYASEKRFEAMSSSNSASLSCVFVWSLSLFSSPSKYESNAASANGESDGESDGDRQ